MIIIAILVYIWLVMKELVPNPFFCFKKKKHFKKSKKLQRYKIN